MISATRILRDIFVALLIFAVVCAAGFCFIDGLTRMNAKDAADAANHR